jgi:putative endonuclease
MCTFYILYAESIDRFYYGHTCMDLERRLKKHLEKHIGFTAKAADWKIVYSETFPDKESAYARERQVKKWKNRKRVVELIMKNG